MKVKVINSVAGQIPPCALLIDQRTIELPECALTTFQVFRNTEHYFSIDAPYDLSKIFDNLCIINSKVNVLPLKCFNCSQSKYKPCTHEQAKIFQSTIAGNTRYEVKCQQCGLNVNGLTEEMLKNLKLLQPTRYRAYRRSAIKTYGER